MSFASEIKRRFSVIVVPILGLGALAYLGYHFFEGERGLKASWALDQRLEKAEAERKVLASERQRIESRVGLLREGSVDRDMLDHIDQRFAEGLAGLVVASADGQAFRLPLEAVARAGIPVQVLGFREHASWALASDTLEFVDLEDIAGVFREPLPRIGLDSLPEQGAWLQPFRPLSSLLTSRV